ncbi:putative UPF0515 protein C19orf66-like [Apostichopus japonicus]|uniref:Putative UPF0515 protein C19orf66-like n=1 Tax=Stichopus japonicus TaxID=307972 RepID=A0A2G8L4B7_STIJA|nr:putative UPF0515 protein C19orf66-like [Apostichopus japonicus]
MPYSVKGDLLSKWVLPCTENCRANVGYKLESHDAVSILCAEIYSVSKAIEREENDSVSITFEITANGTVRCSFRGTLSRINRARSLMEYRLTGGQQADAEPIDGVTPLTLENLTRFNASLTETRQFGCSKCKHVWWRKVFTYKPVSHCPKCNVCYNPIPLDQMFGWGKFVCPCGNVFYGRAQSTRFSPCYSCGEMVRPSVVGPMPTSRPQRTPGQSFSGRRHACEACHSGTIRPCPSYNIMASYSTPHDCTGSTVSTFLTQASTVPSEFGSEMM